MDHIYTEDELIEFRNQLRKYKEIGSKKILSILNRLRLSKVSMAQLKATNISQTINSLSKMSDFPDEKEVEQINELAAQIISKWKKLAEESKSAAQSKSASTASKQSSASAAGTQMSKNQASKPDGQDAPSAQQKKPAASSNNSQASGEQFLEKESAVFEGENLSELPTLKSNTRQMALNAVFKMFMKVEKQMSAKKEEWVDLAVRLEQAVFDRNQIPVQYKSNVRELIGMFTSNEVIIEVTSKLLYNEIKLTDVAQAKSSVFLTDFERSAVQKQQEEQLMINDPEFYNNIRKDRLKGMEGEVCGACKKKTAFLVKELQTRSSDEPMTRFMECNSCGKSWRD